MTTNLIDAFLLRRDVVVCRKRKRMVDDCMRLYVSQLDLDKICRMVEQQVGQERTTCTKLGM